MGNNPKMIYNGFKNLEYRKLVSSKDGNLWFTKKGREWVRLRKYKSLKIKNQKWDGKWRIVIFDVPENLRSKRNQLQRKFKLLGLYMLQKSVFVCPYPCEEELDYVADYLTLNPYIDILLANSVGYKEKEISKYYNLKK